MEENKIIQERDLSSLKGSQRIRLRPSVNLGSDGIRGVQQTLFEVITNSIDRWKAGYGDKVIITRNIDKSFTIQDFADGLPTSWNEKEQAYNWDLALNTLYGGDNYTQSDTLDGKLGNFGLGLSSTMMSSEWMNVIVYRNGLKHTLKFKEGRPVDKVTEEFVKEDNEYHLTKEEGERVLLIEESDNVQLSGTIVSYKPDESVFTSIDVPTEWIETKLRKQAMVNNGLELIFDDKLNETKKTYKFYNITDFINSISNENVSNVIEFKNEAEGRDVPNKPIYKMDYNIAFVFNNKIQLQEYYHNSSELTELHLNVTTLAVEKGLTNAIHKYITNNNLYKKGEKIKFVDILDSLICVLSSRSTKTSYANQTKLSIDNEFIKKFLTEDLEEKLYIYLVENQEESEKICNQLLINLRARIRADEARKGIKKESKSKNSKPLPDKVTDWCTYPREFCEIYIVEGDSAGGSAKQGRNTKFQAVMPTKGKILNVEKQKDNRITASETLQIFNDAIGVSFNGTYNEKNLNYGKIIIMSDADVDGMHIRNLWITYVYRHHIELIENRHLYIAQPPLYKITKGKTEKYVYSDEELEEYLQELGGKDKSVDIQRYKGLTLLALTYFSQYHEGYAVA